MATKGEVFTAYWELAPAKRIQVLKDVGMLDQRAQPAVPMPPKIEQKFFNKAADKDLKKLIEVINRLGV